MLAAALSPMPAAARDRHPRPFMLMNLGPAAVVSVELSAAGRGQYGASLIGRIELPAGSALHLTPPSRMDCRADLRIRFEDGRTDERAGEDLCRTQHIIRVSSAPR